MGKKSREKRTGKDEAARAADAVARKDGRRAQAAAERVASWFIVSAENALRARERGRP